jgi:phosphoribosyl 1,2-cyclic phosphodiesterase
MPLFVKFWGTRGSIPTPGPRTQRYGGNTSCVEIRAGDSVLILDGGTGIRELGVDLLRRSQGKPLTLHLFFSHPHWDHIQGFPFFGPAYSAQHTLYLYGQDDKVYQLLSGQMQSAYFPVNFAELKAKIIAKQFQQGQVTVGGVEVRAFSQKHPGTSLGFSFEFEGKKVVYSTDNELDQLISDPEAPETRPGDLRPLPQPLLAAAQGADLLISDGQYGDAEYLHKVGWGHSRASTAVDFAVQAKCKVLAVFHHDPMQSDREVDAKVAACSARAAHLGSSLKVFGAREGVELKIE